jgi:predicted acetyltransferase
MLELSAPHLRFHRSFLAAADEFLAAGEGHFAHIPALRPEAFTVDLRYDRDALEDPGAFGRLVAWTLSLSDPEAPRPPGYVPCTERWLTVDDEYAGRITLRHRLTEPLLTWGGHIGYSVRPSARRRGHASHALALMLPIAADLGIEQVLVTCDTDNEPSRRTIERNGGVYEDTRVGKLRYWVPTRQPVPDTPRAAVRK